MTEPHLGEPAPTLPRAPFVSERHAPSPVRDLAADLVLGTLLGVLAFVVLRIAYEVWR